VNEVYHLEFALAGLKNTTERLQAVAGTDAHVKAVKVLLHQSTPEWQEWCSKHVSRLPDLQSHIAALEQQRHASSAVDRWVKGNHLRYLQRPLHYLGKDMIDMMAPGGPLPHQHATGNAPCG
jgi:hypothetical protein